MIFVVLASTFVIYLVNAAVFTEVNFDAIIELNDFDACVVWRESSLCWSQWRFCRCHMSNFGTIYGVALK